jgi:hypothetical protein
VVVAAGVVVDVLPVVPVPLVVGVGVGGAVVGVAAVVSSVVEEPVSSVAYTVVGCWGTSSGAGSGFGGSVLMESQSMS